MEELLSFISWIFIEVALIGTGRLAVRAVSLGRWRGEHLGGREGRVFAPAGALSFRQNGARVVTRAGLLLAGLAFYLAIGVLALALSNV